MTNDTPSPIRPEDYEIYSPESSDGKADFPTKIVATLFVVLLFGGLIALVWPK